MNSSNFFGNCNLVAKGLEYGWFFNFWLFVLPIYSFIFVHFWYFWLFLLYVWQFLLTFDSLSSKFDRLCSKLDNFSPEFDCFSCNFDNISSKFDHKLLNFDRFSLQLVIFSAYGQFSSNLDCFLSLLLTNFYHLRIFLSVLESILRLLSHFSNFYKEFLFIKNIFANNLLYFTPRAIFPHSLTPPFSLFNSRFPKRTQAFAASAEKDFTEKSAHFTVIEQRHNIIALPTDIALDRPGRNVSSDRVEAATTTTTKSTLVSGAI